MKPTPAANISRFYIRDKYCVCTVIFKFQSWIQLEIETFLTEDKVIWKQNEIISYFIQNIFDLIHDIRIFCCIFWTFCNILMSYFGKYLVLLTVLVTVIT